MNDRDPLSRDVYCLQGIPIDAVSTHDVTRLIRAAAEKKERLFLSTPNTNFLVAGLADPEFRDALVASDLNIADGMPLVWIARLLQIPVRERVAGSDLLSALDGGASQPGIPLRIAFFGGAEGVGCRACRSINEQARSVVCTGSVFPGFKSVGEMSADAVIEEVNALETDFLIAALGAKKGQIWLHRNIDKIEAPVCAHLGALINMAAGTIRRAPRWMQRIGAEWIWRIKEEPALWRRYWSDGWVLIGLLVTRLFPLAIQLRIDDLRASRYRFEINIQHCAQSANVVWARGIATSRDRETVRRAFQSVGSAEGDIVLDFEGLIGADPGFFGLLLMLKRRLDSEGKTVDIRSVCPRMRRCFRMNGVAFLLDDLVSGINP